MTNIDTSLAARARRRAMLGDRAEQPATDTTTDAATARRRAMLGGQEKETTDAA